MEYENEQPAYDDDARGYRERSNDRGRDDRDAADDRARSASPGARGDRMDSRGPPPPAPEDDDEQARNPGTNLFVTGIHPSLTEADLNDLFAKYGTVEKTNIMRDPHTKESRGFGFVNMASYEDADKAKEALQGEVIEGRTLSIEKARRSKPRGPTPGRYYGPPKREDFRGGRRGGRGGYGDRDDRRGYGGGGGRRDDPYGYRGSRDGRDGRDYDRYRDDRGYGGGSRGGDRGRDRYDDRDRGYGRDDRDGYGGGRRGGGGRDYDGGRPPRDAYAGGDGAAPYDRAPPPAAGEDRYASR